VEGICSLLNRYVDSHGAAEARVPDKLLLLEADQPDGQGQPMQVVVLLVDCRFRPKVQIFCRCCLKGGDGQLNFRLPEEPAGTQVSLAVRACKLSLRFQTLHLVTSDDLARDLAERFPVWRLIVLDWELLRGSRNLLDMQIRGRGDVFLPVKAASRNKNCKQAGQALAALDILDAGDPFEIGQSRAEQSARSRPGCWLRSQRHLSYPLAIQRLHFTMTAPAAASTWQQPTTTFASAARATQGSPHNLVS
jgi:hypothetical protein